MRLHDLDGNGFPLFIVFFFTQVVQDFTTIHSMEMETGDPFILW